MLLLIFMYRQDTIGLAKALFQNDKHCYILQISGNSYLLKQSLNS